MQSTPNKTLSGIVGATNAGGIKVFKTPGQESQVLSSGTTQVVRTISLQSPSTPGQSELYFLIILLILTMKDSLLLTEKKKKTNHLLNI